MERSSIRRKASSGNLPPDPEEALLERQQLITGDSSGDLPSITIIDEGTVDTAPLNDNTGSKHSRASSGGSSIVTRTGLMVLCLLAVQNCSKNLIMRAVMKDQPKFLTSAAVILSEFLKLSASILYILCYEGKSPQSIWHYLKDDRRNTALLIVPASAYNLQMSLEYVALANLNAAMFSVLVQTKLLFTATCAAVILRKRLRYIQVISLVLLTVGVMLCNMSGKNSDSSSADASLNIVKGVMATMGIAVSSGFASVYTEKVIKAQRRPASIADGEYSLAYTQVQLALMSLLTIGVYALLKDHTVIAAHGLFYNFTGGAFLSVCMSAGGGLSKSFPKNARVDLSVADLSPPSCHALLCYAVVAAVLKYADSVLKGYATAMSVILTGLMSMALFGTSLSTIYFMGIINGTWFFLWGWMRCRGVLCGRVRWLLSFSKSSHPCIATISGDNSGHGSLALQWQGFGSVCLCRRAQHVTTSERRGVVRRWMDHSVWSHPLPTANWLCPSG
jgi:UDP-sugar transporter A1/2/3